jgi:hypothetical protein
VGEPLNNVPSEFSLNQNYPNPFNPSTEITFSLPHGSQVSLKVYDVLGREIATLVNAKLEAGSHHATWNAGSFASGMYFYKIQTDNQTAIKKMMLLK